MDVLDLIEASIPALRRYAHGLVRDRDLADDLVQDCLERAVAGRRHWRGDGPVRAWLFRILLNLYRDELRRRPARGHLVAIDALAAPPSCDGGQEQRLALREVHEAMGRLPAAQREVLLLVAVEGMKYDEAAEILGVARGTVMSRLARARMQLRALVQTDPAVRPARGESGEG